MSSRAQIQFPDIPCVILSGGLSKRFGSNKAEALFRGRKLIEHLIARLETQTRGPIAINAPSKAGYEVHQRPLFSDEITGSIGPLSGIHAAMSWAEKNGFSQIITTPVDTPILPVDFVARLHETGSPSIATHEGRAHPLHGIWSATLKPDLEAAIADGMRAARDWAARCEARSCEFPTTEDGDPFFNINTIDDLAEISQRS